MVQRFEGFHHTLTNLRDLISRSPVARKRCLIDQLGSMLIETGRFSNARSRPERNFLVEGLSATVLLDDPRRTNSAAS